MTAQAVTPGHPLSRIDFYADGTVVGSVPIPGGVTTATVSYTWSGATSGVRTLIARAVAIDGYATVSSPVSIEVGDFVVALAEPFAGQMYQAPADIRITANPTETGAAVAQVDFYGDGALLGSRAAPPYSFVWTGVAAGAHTVSAKARDTNGFSVGSASVPVTVLSAPTIAVDGGIDGSTLADDNATITGIVQAPLNSALIVNGKAAALDRNGRFFVDNILLQPGTNTVTSAIEHARRDAGLANGDDRQQRHGAVPGHARPAGRARAAVGDDDDNESRECRFPAHRNRSER